MQTWLAPLICFFLVISVTVIYWEVKSYDFLYFDDTMYVTKNGNVQKGVTIENIKWAFSLSSYGNYWHPLTWISHMMDCEFFGMNSGMHHITNVMIHCVNSVLLFLIFWWMTGAFWKSAIIAALFALHPINVESVAWIAQRKNVLSTFFLFITLLILYILCKNTRPVEVFFDPNHIYIRPSDKTDAGHGTLFAAAPRLLAFKTISAENKEKQC